MAKFIYFKIILEHGCPSGILSDNGKEFKNAIIDNLCTLMSINKKFSSPYKPSTNGLIERTNKTLIAILSKIAYREKENLNQLLMLNVLTTT